MGYLMENQLSIDDKILNLDKVLDDFESSTGLPLNTPKTIEIEAKRLLELEPEYLSKLSAEQCGEASVVLEQFSFYLQKIMNRESSKIKWSNEAINKIIGSTILFQKGYGFEERRIAAIRENDAATKLQNIKVKHELRAERISYLSSKIDSLSKSFIALQQTKRGKN